MASWNKPDMTAVVINLLSYYGYQVIKRTDQAYDLCTVNFLPLR